MKYKNILFDLDGTITDSEEGILNGIIFALNKLKLPILERNSLRLFIGPPLKESFQSVFQLSSEEANQAVVYYREYYEEKGMLENKLYVGVTEVLINLKEAGCHLYLATSKPEIYAKKILTHFHLESYFEGVYGASLDGLRSKKSSVIKYALEQAQITTLNNTIMIGDRNHDIIGGKENGIESVGVLYGFGDYDELQKAGAIYIAETPKQMGVFLLKD